MPFKRRINPITDELREQISAMQQQIQEQQELLDRINSVISSNIITRTYNTITGLTNWTIINVYGNGMCECCGQMDNPYWTVHEDHVQSNLVIVRLPVTFINTDYHVVTGSQTDTTKRRIGAPNCDYGNIHEVGNYKKTTTSFPMNICGHYTKFYFRILGYIK